MSRRSWDGKKWAEFFMATMKEQGWAIEDIDEGLMLGWFANAQMGMYDLVCDERDHYRTGLEEIVDHARATVKPEALHRVKSYCIAIEKLYKPWVDRVEKLLPKEDSHAM